MSLVMEAQAGRSSVVLTRTREELSWALERARARSLGPIGFVPTMGALHEGHVSLIQAARKQCGEVVVSIFVNPTQFGPGEDYDTYPRDLDGDLEIATRAGASVVFAPPVEEIYPQGCDSQEEDLPREVVEAIEAGGLITRLEGADRPGHFLGVARVVFRLLSLVGQSRAFFGEKDYQQLAVVRRLVEASRLPVEVVGCPTVREPDGLALSSRNRRLSVLQRPQATALFRALLRGSELVGSGETEASRVVTAMLEVMDGEPDVRPSYASVADPLTLEPLETLGRGGNCQGEVRLLVAARLGSVRLIDNMPAYLPGTNANQRQTSQIGREG
jgi:pantoate--beta-alanine ligase